MNIKLHTSTIPMCELLNVSFCVNFNSMFPFNVMQREKRGKESLNDKYSIWQAQGCQHNNYNLKKCQMQAGNQSINNLKSSSK